MKGHLGFRASAQLQKAVSQVGETSAAARALIIIGLAECGYDVSTLAGDVALTTIDLDVQQKLLSVLNKRTTDVPRMLHAPQLVMKEVEEETDPLDIGIAV